MLLVCNIYDECNYKILSDHMKCSNFDRRTQHHLYWGYHSWNCNTWSTFQGCQCPHMACETQSTNQRMEKISQTFWKRRRFWKQRWQNQLTSPNYDLKKIGTGLWVLLFFLLMKKALLIKYLSKLTNMQKLLWTSDINESLHVVGEKHFYFKMFCDFTLF